MKKVLTLILGIVLAVNCTAFTAGDSTYDYVVNDTAITIVFDFDSALTADKQEQIAHHMVYGDDGASTYAWCWLTGHTIVTENVTEIQHKVRDLSPRCIQRIYSVETCTKCDHLEETLIAENLIACCPQD